jgi:hypothetical protein
MLLRHIRYLKAVADLGMTYRLSKKSVLDDYDQKPGFSPDAAIRPRRFRNRSTAPAAAIARRAR